jgi:hypothetical protein
MEASGWRGGGRRQRIPISGRAQLANATLAGIIDQFGGQLGRLLADNRGGENKALACRLGQVRKRPAERASDLVSRTWPIVCQPPAAAAKPIAVVVLVDVRNRRLASCGPNASL